ncbi:MAG: type IV pilus biogenesis protein PilM [Sulfuriferula sp.]
MGIIWPLIVFVMFFGLNSVAAYRSKQLSQPSAAVIASVSAQKFLTYRNAVSNYMSSNPAFTGTISLSSLSSYLNGATSAAMAGMANVISAAQGGGTQIIVTAQSTEAAAGAAFSLTGYDASIGRASGGQWTSYSSATAGTRVSIPDSNLVSMTQIN